MAEEAKQTDATLITPLPSDEVQPEPDPPAASSTDLIRNAFVTDGEEPSTSMGDTFDFSYPEGGTSFSQQPTTLQELNIGNLRKQLISQCDFNVADIESWKSMGLSVKDLKHLELDDLLKNPVLTPSYQVTKFRWLQTQLEASALDKTGSLSSHNSMVDTVTITNKNYLKISEDSEKSFVAEGTEMSAVKLEEMLGNFELSNVHNLEQCLTQFKLSERPDSETSVTAMSPVSSHVSIVDTSPEKCAILNSNPASILNHLSTDLSEEMSDNCGTSLFNDDVFKPDSPIMDQSSSVDPLLIGTKTVHKSHHHHTESSRRKCHHENLKTKTTGGSTKRDSKYVLKRHEDVSSVSRTHEKANDKKMSRSEQTQERNAAERKACDHVGLNITSANAKDRKDCTRKEIVHSNKNEESVVKSVIISFSQEKVKVITDLVEEEVCQPMKDIVQVTTGLETKKLNTLEEEKEWSEYRPIDPLVSRKLDALVSSRDDGVDDAITPVDLKLNNDDKEESSAAKIRDILLLEDRVISPEKIKNADNSDEPKVNVGCYSCEKEMNSVQNPNGGVDLNKVDQDCLIENTPQKIKLENEDDLTKMSCVDNSQIYKGLSTSVTNSVTGAEYKDNSFPCTDEGKENAGKDINEKDVMNYGEDGRNLYEEKMDGFTNTTTKTELTKITDQKKTVTFKEKNDEADSLPGIVQTSVNYQTENMIPLNYIDHEKNAQISNDLKNGDAFLSPDFSSSDPDEFRVNLNQDTRQTSPLIGEDGNDKVTNSLADISPSYVTEKGIKTYGEEVSYSGSMLVFEENAEQLPRPVEDIDSRVVGVKIAVTTRQTSDDASGKCQLQTLEEDSELKISKSPKPYHLANSESSILTVNNDSQPNGSIRITCKVKEDFSDDEQPIGSQEDVDVISSKLSRVNYRSSDVTDTPIGASSVMDNTGIPGHLETTQSVDFLKTTSSVNITECSPTPINSVLLDLEQSKNEDQVNIVDVTDELIGNQLNKTEPISDLEPTAAVENNLQSAAIEKQTQDTICLNTNPDIISLMFTCPQMIADCPETVETNNILIRDDLESEPCEAIERNVESKQEDSTFDLPCPAQKETDNQWQEIKRNDPDLELRPVSETTPDAVTVEKVTDFDTRINVAASPVRTREVLSARGREEIKNCQKRQAQNVEPVTASVTSKVEITTTSRVIRQPQEHRSEGTSDAKDARNLTLRDETCKELWESNNDDDLRICHFSQSQKPSTVFKQILRTESSQIFGTGDDRKIFSKSVEFSNSLQKESTRFKVTKNIYQVQQRKSSYGQMKVIEKGVRNVPAKKCYNREASFEKDARIANRFQQMTFIQDGGRNNSQRRQIDVVQNSKKTTKSTIKNVNILEPIRSNKGKELSEKNSNPKNNFKKSVSLNLKNEKTVVVPTEALESQSSGDTIHQERILPENFYESGKSDGKGDLCHNLAYDDNSHHCPKRGATDEQRKGKSAKQSQTKSIAMSKNKNKGHFSAPSGRRKKIKMPKYLQAGSLESCQGTLSSVQISSLEISPRCTSRSSLATQSFKSAPNSLESPRPQEEKNSQQIHSCSSQKSTSRKPHVSSSSEFQAQYEPPEFNMAFIDPEKIRDRSRVTTDKTSAEDNLPDRSDSSSPADAKFTSFYFENQPTYSSSDISVFPISCTDMHEETGRMYSNLNDYKTNRDFLNQGQLLQTLCYRLGDNRSPSDLSQDPKNQNAIYLTESMFNNLSRKKRQDPYGHSAPLPPPPSPPSPPPHSKCFSQRRHDKDVKSDMIPIPKTFGKEHQNFKNIRELKALEKSLKRETTRIQKPPQVKFQPYIFTSLEPYYDTSLVRYMMEHPHGSYPGYRSRQTALGLCDPAEDLKLDTYILPKVSVKTMKKIQDNYKKTKKSLEKRCPPKSSSTRASTFPMVSLEGQKMTKRQLTFSDVPMLRKELQEKCTMNAQKKILQDYERTKEDFYRLELDRLNEIHPINRANVRASYFAYLQNTPGSRKAIYDCIQKNNQK